MQIDDPCHAGRVISMVSYARRRLRIQTAAHLRMWTSCHEAQHKARFKAQATQVCGLLLGGNVARINHFEAFQSRTTSSEYALLSITTTR